MEFDLLDFGQKLFDTMINSVNMGLNPPMTFAISRNGKTEIETLPDQAGSFLSNGRFKDQMFAFWRGKCADPAVEAFACGSEQWGFAANESGARLVRDDPKKYKSLIDHGFTKLVAGGYGEVHETFSVVAQTRTKVVLMNRRFHRVGARIEWLGDPVVEETTQDLFGGRQKMWGDLRPENLS